MTWACYMVEQVEEQEAWLRRYVSGSCPAMPGDHSYHNASAHVGRIPLTYGRSEGETAHSFIENVDPSAYDGDERWPTRCACGYEFASDDNWQVLGRQCWRRPDTGEVRVIDGYWRSDEQVPTWEPGAMFYAWWLDGIDRYRGPEGRCLSVTLPPDGYPWHIDGPSSSGGKWTRSGEPPLITATPSILTGKYHGFLQNGVLTDSLSDRPL